MAVRRLRRRETPDDERRYWLAEVLLGLPGFRVLDAVEEPDELVVTVETTATAAWCASCGVRARPHERRTAEVRDLACFGRPSRLVWRKRRWRCREDGCAAKTWTERSAHVDAQVVIMSRAGIEVCRQVGELARPVAQVADEFGVCWWTVMNAVTEHGTPLVDDPDSVGSVRQLGVDETSSFLKANRWRPTRYATGLVDLEAGGEKGGRERTKRLSPEQHSKIARKAAQARWRRRA